MSDQPTIIDCVQRSPEWFAARRGIPTASRSADIVAKIKKGEAAPRRHYREELIGEILSGVTAPNYESREMRWGIDQEPYARAAYENQQDVLVHTCGFVVHPTIKRFGASPDGLIGSDGMLQIKCPNTATHIAWMTAGEIPLDHAAQCLGDLACTNRQWIDFVSFDPRLPQDTQLFIRRFHRNENLISSLETEVVQFIAELDSALAALTGKKPVPAMQDIPTAKNSDKLPAVPNAKPTYDDTHPVTGHRLYAKYADYETAKDEWMLHQVKIILEQAMIIPKGATIQ